MDLMTELEILQRSVNNIRVLEKSLYMLLQTMLANPFTIIKMPLQRILPKPC